MEYINSLLLYDISPLVQEEEIYEVLKDVSKGLCSITMFDTLTPHKVLSAGLCLIEYDDYFTARHGMLSIIQRHAELRGTLSPNFKIMWAEPLFDYSGEFALHSRAVEIKNVPLSFSTERIYDIFKRFGNVLKIRRYAGSGVVYFAKAGEAKAAREELTEFELENGVTCKVTMAKTCIEEPTEQAAEARSINLHEVGSTESMALVQQLMYENSPISEMLLNKARNIIKAEMSKAVIQQEQVMYESISAVADSSLQGKRPPEIERSTYQHKKPKPDDGSFVSPRYAGTPPAYNSAAYQYRPNVPAVRSVAPEPAVSWEHRRASAAPRSGFTQITREAFERMPKEDKIKYVQQYYQMINSINGQAYSRLPP
eukprot:TRINITY_DN10590_c0_g1_i1.p2 TRINITY_DN10590_c0_g1~~TRINITY_DN10590_c0_g1_i1.p2  ORF type:complete len:369 (+),score=98.18 TRINITY_DN10590_c0_g1_i1:248-1354(+)